jgi:hypothetical protein
MTAQGQDQGQDQQSSNAAAAGRASQRSREPLAASKVGLGLVGFVVARRRGR